MADTLVGRGEDVSLTSAGRAQLAVLAQRLALEAAPAAIYCSPRRRTRETAQAIAAATNAQVCVEPAFDEIDFGAWTGRSFRQLQDDPTWQQWNTARTQARAPGGESMVAVQARAVRKATALAAEHADGHVVIVSHAEIVRAALLHYLGLPLEAYAHIEIGAASRSCVEIAPWGARVLSLNERAVA